MRGTTVLPILLSLLALSAGPAGAEFHLGLGVGYAPEGQHYLQTETKSGAYALGLGRSMLPWLATTIELDHFHYGRQPSVTTDPEERVIWRDSNMTMGLAGLEMRIPTTHGSGLFVTAGLGLARVAIGDEHVRDLNGGDFVLRGDRILALALGIGAGVRTPRFARGPRLEMAIRSVQAHLSGQNVSVVPLTVGLSFWNAPGVTPPPRGSHARDR